MVEPLVVLIVACEIGFWVVLGAGLLARYALRMRRLGAVLLFCTPLVDVVLLVATVFDLRAGGEATSVHGLAAIYLGVSVAFGHSMLRWADQRVAHRFAGGPAAGEAAQARHGEGPPRVARVGQVRGGVGDRLLGDAGAHVRRGHAGAHAGAMGADGEHDARRRDLAGGLARVPHRRRTVKGGVSGRTRQEAADKGE